MRMRACESQLRQDAMEYARKCRKHAASKPRTISRKKKK